MSFGGKKRKYTLDIRETHGSSCFLGTVIHFVIVYSSLCHFVSSNLCSVISYLFFGLIIIICIILVLLALKRMLPSGLMEFGFRMT